MRKVFATLCLITVCAACQRVPEAIPEETQERRRPAPPLPNFRDAALALGAGDCTDLLKVKAAPHKQGVLGADPYWDRIVVHAEHYRPCLAEAVTDHTPVQGILFGPGNPAHTVGDVAYALLVDSGFVKWGICVPPEVNSSSRGAVAVRDWLSRPGNRSAWESCLKREMEGEFNHQVQHSVNELKRAEITMSFPRS